MATSDDTWHRLATVVGELMAARRQLADLVVVERATRLDAWLSASSDLGKITDTQRTKLSDINTHPLTAEIIKLKGEIEALTDERDYLRLVIEYDGKD